VLPSYHSGVLRLSVAVAATGVLVSAASASGSTPGGLARSVIFEWTRGSPGAAWVSMHPAHQRVVSQKQFAYCVRVGRGERLYPTRVTIGGWRSVQINRREIPQRSGWSVRLVIRRKYRGLTSREDWRLQVVRVDGRFRWLLDKSFFKQYRELRRQPKACPE
jgi:hypothetical protein